MLFITKKDKKIKIIFITLLLLLTPINARAEIYPISKIVDVYDGDSFTLLIAIPDFDLYIKVKCRLDGIDCPEIRGKTLEERQLAIKARDCTRKFLDRPECMVNIKGREKYGRFLVEIFSGDVSLNKYLITCGYARPYDGGKREPWFPTEHSDNPISSIIEGLEGLE